MLRYHFVHQDPTLDVRYLWSPTKLGERTELNVGLIAWNCNSALLQWLWSEVRRTLSNTQGSWPLNAKSGHFNLVLLCDTNHFRWANTTNPLHWWFTGNHGVAGRENVTEFWAPVLLRRDAACVGVWRERTTVRRDNLWYLELTCTVLWCIRALPSEFRRKAAYSWCHCSVWLGRPMTSVVVVERLIKILLGGKLMNHMEREGPQVFGWDVNSVGILLIDEVGY